MTIVQGINQHGVARMSRLLAVLQPALSSLGATGGAFRPESARAFEKARAYYGLLTVPADALLRAAAERPTRFTATEYTAMLQVSLFCSTLVTEFEYFLPHVQDNAIMLCCWRRCQECYDAI